MAESQTNIPEPVRPPVSMGTGPRQHSASSAGDDPQSAAQGEGSPQAPDLGDDNPEDIEYSDYDLPDLRPDLSEAADEEGPIEDEDLLDDEPLASSDAETPEPGSSVPRLTGSTEGAEGETRSSIRDRSLAGRAGGSEPPAPLTIPEARRRIFARHNTTVSADDPILLVVTILEAGQERQRELSDWSRQELVEVVRQSHATFEAAARELSEDLYSQSSEAAAEVIASNLKEMAREAGGVTETLQVMKKTVRRTIAAMSFLTLIVVSSVFAIYIILQ